MSSNIFGYQGVNTPLESLTNGRYNVADYTTLRETVDARLSVLEKDQAQPTNVTVSGSLSVVASNTNAGTLTVANTGSFGSTLFANGTMSSNGGLLIAQNGQIGGTLTSTGIMYPLSGIEFSDGTTLNTATTTEAPTIYVDALFYSQTLNQVIVPAGSTYKSTEINLQYNNNCTVDLSNLNCEDTTAFPDGVRYVSITKANMADDLLNDYVVTLLCPSPNYLFYGASISDVNTITIPVGVYGTTLAIFLFNAGTQRRTYVKSIVRTPPNTYVACMQAGPVLNATYTPVAGPEKTSEIFLNSNYDCIVNLVQFTCEDTDAFPDGVRYVTIYKSNYWVGDYVVTIQCPGYGSGIQYPIYSKDGAGTTTYTLGLGSFSVTFVMRLNTGPDRRTLVKSLVN